MPVQASNPLKVGQVAKIGPPLSILCVAILLVGPVDRATGAGKLPSDEEVNGILKLCAMGRIQSFEGDVRGKIELWKKELEGKAAVSQKDVGALVNLLQDVKIDQSSVAFYKVYTECVGSSIEKFTGLAK